MKRAIRLIGWLIVVLPLPAPSTAGQVVHAPELPRRPQLWAIIVGVGSPRDPQLRPLGNRQAVQQAFNVLKWFSGTAGWDRSHLLLLTDFGGDDEPGLPRSPAPNINASKKNLDWAFQTWLASKARPGDAIVVYFAGQARALVSGDRGVSPEYYLLPTDAAVDNLSARGWTLDRALDAYARQGKYQVICWLATALQVQHAAGSDKKRSVDLDRLHRDWLRRLARWPAVTAWLASNRPPANPAADPAVPFTSALLEGLGTRESRQNLAACLRTLQRNSKLKAAGFQSVGGVPPRLTLWAHEFGTAVQEPRPEMILQVGHADRVLDIVSTADSRMVITASQDSTVRVWAPAQKALLRVLTGHVVGATTLGLSRDGRWLVSGGGRGEILIHDLAEDFRRRSIVRQPHDERARVEQIAMLPDGNHFVSVDSQGKAFRWNLAQPSLGPQPWIADVTCRKVAHGGSGTNGVVAALCSDGTVRLFDSAGTGGTTVPISGGHPSTIAVTTQGDLVGVGCDNGLVVVRDVAAGKQVDQIVVQSKIEHLAFSSTQVLAIGHENGVQLVEVKLGPWIGKSSGLIVDKSVNQLTFTPDGRLLAGCARNDGTLWVWRIDDAARHEPVISQAQAGVLALAFSSDSRTLISGDKLGSVQTWPLEDRAGATGWAIVANRGKIQHLSTSPGRGFVLVINELHRAYLWDLARRSCRRLAGLWSSGTFVNDDLLVLADRPGGGHFGSLVRVDRRTLAVDRGHFARSNHDFKLPAEVRFDVVTLSADGARIAASAGRSQIPLVCVWETSSGKLTHWITDAVLDHPAFSLSFSSDGRELATAGDSTQAEVWDLDRHKGALEAPAVTIQDRKSSDISCVQIRPTVHGQMVSGHSNGRLLLWKWESGKPRQTAPTQVLAERYFDGAVHAISFTPDGRYLAAAGDGTMIWLAQMEPRVVPIRNLGTPPHHHEQINALSVWTDYSASVRLCLGSILGPGVPVVSQPPQAPVLLSGSDDTTIRFWDLEKRSLLGTFCSAQEEAERDEPAQEDASRELDWVLYTPDGHFDASASGRELVRFRQGDRGHSMEQFDGTALYSFELSDLLRLGQRLEPAKLDAPPPLAIDPPPDEDPLQPLKKLTILLGPADFQDVRLYHNGVPIPNGLEDRSPPLPDRIEVQVRLLPGLNRFYAMASREGAFDSRSQELEIPFEGSIEPGRLHVVALGVGNYDREKLNFAKRDAEKISEVLHRRGISTGQMRGKSVLLTDELVNLRDVTNAFGEVSRAVRGHPQDTVVLFLAGHTGVFDKERFCLLLSKYPFPAEAPLLVAARAANPPVAPGAKVSPEDLLPYSSLAANLMRLDALNRLVIVDACQAEAILADPQVEAIRKFMEIGSRRARTSYLMAARRGEPALEVKPLGHGLFTYTLLRGMREIPLQAEPDEVTRLKLRPDADYNADGLITTAELDTYVSESLPPLAGLFPQLVVARRAAVNPKQAAPPIASDRLDQSLHLQTARISFPLIRLNRDNPAGP